MGNQKGVRKRNRAGLREAAPLRLPGSSGPETLGDSRLFVEVRLADASPLPDSER